MLPGLMIWLLGPAGAVAQEAGPVISSYGEVWFVEATDLPLAAGQDFKAVFDVSDSPESRGVLNPHLETAARFLNLHARAGMDPGNLKVALVVHGKASEDLLSPEAYLMKHGRENPNAGLVRDLLDAGVQIAICGQSATARNISKEQTAPGVLWSLSAMTALVYFQNEGYQFIKF